MSKYLICGFGNIGKHILKEFESISDEFAIYDKYCHAQNINGKNIDIGDESILDDDYDIAFICVPTEMNDDGSCDISEVEWIYDRLSKSDNVNTVVIKSAVPVGTAGTLFSKYTEEPSYQWCPTIVISPEFYGTTQHAEESPNFLILGTKIGNANSVVQLYQRVKDASFRFIFTDWKTAELVKYMENCWIATKVTFCNEFATIAKYFRINYNELRECWLADPRVSPSHTFVYEDKPYYDSHCLNKDIPALISFANSKSPLMEAVNTINKARKDEDRTS